MMPRVLRSVANACRECKMSDTYCQCCRELDRQPCCDACTH